MNEASGAAQYLVDYLSADETLMSMINGVWRKSVPQSEPFPVIKIDRLEGDDLMVVGAYRVWADLLFNVRGIIHWRGGGQPDYTDVRAIGSRIDVLLHKHEGMNSEVQVHAFREEPFDDETVESGDLFLHDGGLYRLRARSL